MTQSVTQGHTQDVELCNWPEARGTAKNNLTEGQAAQDCPDLVAWVFKLRKDMLLEDLVRNAVFAQVLAHLWVVEFQKCGSRLLGGQTHRDHPCH